MIRTATVADAEAILAIYAYYVKHTAITFEYEVPSIEEFRGRIEKTLKQYPYLVSIREGKIVGYAYAGPLKERAAYDRSVETTIYLEHGREKEGLGKELYTALEKALRAMNILNEYACIGYPEKNDEYLSQNSAEYHEHLGWRRVGIFYNCGYKFGRWYHMVWMEKFLTKSSENSLDPSETHPKTPDPIIPFPICLEKNMVSFE